ncbi:MAG: STAS domain-containing protein [Gammaproteobacteria bacterium]|nr:STAS domain-containing protein [Gammaproteobacteria bacterium]
MKLVHKKNQLSVVGALDRFQLVRKEQFVFPNINEDEVFLDLVKAKNVDTAGLAWLLKLVSYYQSQKKVIAISNVPEQLIALAQLSNVLALLPINESAEV